VGSIPAGRTNDLVVDSNSNKYEYQGCLGRWGKGGRCLRMTILPPSCADHLEILGASTSWSPQDMSRHECGVFSSKKGSENTGVVYNITSNVSSNEQRTCFSSEIDP